VARPSHPLDGLAAAGRRRSGRRGPPLDRAARGRRRAATVDGVLTYAHAAAWWPWALVVIAVGTALWLLARRLGPPSRVAALATLAAGLAAAVAVALSGAEQLAIPAEAGRRLVPVVVPAVGVVLAAAALVLGRNDERATLARNLGLAAVAAAAGWALLRLDVFTKPVLVTDLAPGLDRAGTAVVLALSLTAAALLALHPSPPPPAVERRPDLPIRTADPQARG
jgi:hypothetical protein